MKFIFDIDGTLTPSRRKIDADFHDFFLDFAENNEVYLVTGSNREKTIEQIGENLFNKCKRVYNCAGNDVYEGDTNVYRNSWELPNDARRFLQDELDYSVFPIRTGTHIEKRPGCVNFSILGRGATFEKRDVYKQWDKEREERVDIAGRFNDRFPALYAFVGGETGVDISIKGADKSQILRDFKQGDDLRFFGDRMDEHGNDYPLAISIAENYMGYAFQVKDYKEVWKVLKMGIR